MAGDVDPAHVIQRIGDHERHRQLPPGGPIGRIYPDEPPAVAQKRIEQRMPVATPLWMMGYKDDRVGLSGADLLRRDLTMGLLWSLLLGPSSQLFNDLYQDGLINERFSAHYSSAPTYGLSQMGGETPEPERLEAVLLERLGNEPLKPQNLARIKRKEIGDFVGLFENLEELAFAFTAFHFRGIDLAEVPAVLADISLAEVEKSRREHLRESMRATSVVLPLATNP